jgi:Ca-activated chloride channel homolog
LPGGDAKSSLERGARRVTLSHMVFRSGLLLLLAACATAVDAQPAPKLRVVQLVAPGKPAGAFSRALANMDVGVKEIGKLTAAKDLAGYDVVVLSDVPAHLIGATHMAALESYVQGGGVLLAAGGADSFATGGYQATRVEKLLPVRFDSEQTKSQPDFAIAIVVDTSDAMKGKWIEEARAAATIFTEGLGPSEYIGVFGFDATAKIWVRPQRAANRQRIAADIKGLTGGGATANLHAGMREAFEYLQGVSTRRKHVIVVSNAVPVEDGIADLVDDMRASRITVSTFAGPKARRELFTKIAKAGDGRYYAVDDPALLSRQLARELAETLTLRASDKTFARIAKRLPLVADVDKAPALHGYVTTKPKPTSEVLLITDEGEPLFARWCVGAGTAAVWTTDLEGAWSKDWVNWTGYAKFWTQLVRGVRLKCATK